MRILFAVHGYKPAYKVGGPIESVSAVAERLVRRGHDVTVFTSNWNLTEELDVECGRPVAVEGVKVWYFPVVNPMRRLAPSWSTGLRLTNYIFTPAMLPVLRRSIGQFDIAHTHLPFIFPTLAVARAATQQGIPFCYHQRGVFDPARMAYRSGKKALYFRAIEARYAARASRLFALTRAEADSYRNLGLTNPISQVPNGVDAQAFARAPRPERLEAVGVAAGDRVVLFLGRLHPTKGVDALLQAFIQIGDEFPSAKLVLAGPDELGVRESHLRRVHAAGLGERVLIPGSVTGQAKMDLLKRADVFCLPSHAEGFSMAILEAMAASTAVLISAGCHFPEAVTAGAGLETEIDADSIAAGLTRLLSNPELTAHMGRRGQSLVSREYDWDGVVTSFETIYGEILQRRAPADHRDARKNST
jgi:glycosyltransferase involved in cell wall biosynthesis